MSEEQDNIDEKQIVLPGEILSEDTRMLPGRGSVRDGNKIRAIFIGLKSIRGKYINVVPLKGQLYTPEVGDKIIGLIENKTAVKWLVDINGKEPAVLRPSDVLDRQMKKPYGGKKQSRREQENEALKMYGPGDLLICKIMSYDRVSAPSITTLGEGLGPLKDGLVIQVEVPKIPRIIGKRGSMIKLLKELTSCRLFVAKNGRVWLSGKTELHERLLIDTIRKIERESHTSRLTDRIELFIKEEKEKRGIN